MFDINNKKGLTRAKREIKARIKKNSSIILGTTYEIKLIHTLKDEIKKLWCASWDPGILPNFR